MFTLCTDCALWLAKPLIPIALKCDPVVAVSPLYSTPAQPPRLAAVPTDRDFIAALQGLGVNTQQAGQGDEAKQQGLSESQEQQPAKGTMHHLPAFVLAASWHCSMEAWDDKGIRFRVEG